MDLRRLVKLCGFIGEKREDAGFKEITEMLSEKLKVLSSVALSNIGVLR